MWVQQTSPSPDSFFDVFFKSETEGWAVGENGVIAYTTDGTNWSLHTSSGVYTTADINTVWFFGNSGWFGCDNNEIWITTDNGANWSLAQSFGDTVEGISFASALVGVAALDGAGCYYTTDGGVTWTQGSMNLGSYPYTRNDIEEIIMLDTSNAIATGWGSMYGAQPTIIVRSTDGGQNWNIANTDYHWNTYGYGYGFTKFANGEVLLAGGGYGTAGFVLSSTDNGANWTSKTPVTGEILGGIAVVPGTNHVVAAGEGGCLALSTDRAVNWTFLYDPIYGFYGFQKIRSWGSRGLAVGDRGAFCEIEDGTVTWKNILVNNFSGRMHDLWAVQTADSLEYVLYACGAYGSAYKSTDKGETWIELLHNFTATSCWHSMWWFDKLNGMLVGEISGDDAIWVTDDGGDSWTEIWYNVKSEQFNSVSFAPDDPSIGVIGGNKIALYYTTDGGANWAAATEDIVSTTADIEEVWMVDENVGWAVGDAGIIAKTTDGGATWLQQPSFTGTTLMDVYFDHPLLGWVSGDDGTCFRTENGGATWTDINASLELGSRDANAVYFRRASNVLWLGAEHFDLLSRFEQELIPHYEPAAHMIISTAYGSEVAVGGADGLIKASVGLAGEYEATEAIFGYRFCGDTEPFQVFAVDTDGSAPRSSTIYPASSGDGWSGYFDPSGLPTEGACVQFEAALLVSDHGYLRDTVEVLIDPTPPIPVFDDIHRDSIASLGLDSIFDVTFHVEDELMDLFAGELLVFTLSVDFHRDLTVINQLKLGTAIDSVSCGPTAAASCLKYFADNGYPGLKHAEGKVTNPELSGEDIARELQGAMGKNSCGVTDNEMIAGIRSYFNSHKQKGWSIDPHNADEALGLAKMIRDFEVEKEDVIALLQDTTATGDTIFHWVTLGSTRWTCYETSDTTLINGTTKLSIDFMDPWEGGSQAEHQYPLDVSDGGGRTAGYDLNDQGGDAKIISYVKVSPPEDGEPPELAQRARQATASLEGWILVDSGPVRGNGLVDTLRWDTSPFPGGLYLMEIVTTNNQGIRCRDIRLATIPVSTTHIDNPVPEIKTILRSSYPNPFNPATTIEYALAAKTKVTLAIYDVGGRRLRVLLQGTEVEAGVHKIGWDGRNDRGKLVASGIYFCHLVAGDYVQTKKMVLLR